MSETPRTDAARQDEHDPYMAVASECSKMEKELNAANQRIKRLEEAGDALLSHSHCTNYHEKVAEWNEAKRIRL